MTNFNKHALTALQKAGYKLTAPRRAVLEVLAKSKKPLSPYDIQKTLSQSTPLNHVTIYRILEVLLELKLVHKIPDSGFQKCTQPESSGCHHFMICQDCGQTEEFIEKSHCSHSHLPATPSRFTVKDHFLQLLGQCFTCQQQSLSKTAKTSAQDP